MSSSPSELKLYQDKCLICKLLTAPLMFGIGGYFAFKNRMEYSSIALNPRNDYFTEGMSKLSFNKFLKIGMITVPVVMFAAGSHLLYEAFFIFKIQQQNA